MEVIIYKNEECKYVVQGESELIIHLSDGSSIELIVDSIHMNVQDLDD